MQANPWRGEAELVLDSKIYILRPTFTALSAIEHQLETGLIHLAQKLAKGTLTLDELTAIIWHGLQHDAPSFTIQELRDSILRSSIALTMESVATMFTHIFEAFHDGHR